MKYYIYISDSKLDMLFPQIPHDTKKKIATELKLDLKLLSASRKLERETEENRINRLEAVLAFLNDFGDVGSVDEPSAYIQDAIPMVWKYVSVEDDSVENLVYFAGATEKTIIGVVS